MAADGTPKIRMEDLISYLEIQKSPRENMTVTSAPQQPYPIVF
jgi:hypothetical protein